MKRPVGIALGLCLVASPALAGVAIINGGGTNGLAASGTCNSGASCPTTTTVVSSATTVDIPVGSLVVAGSAVRSANNGCASVTDSAGNTYTIGANKGSGGVQSASLIATITTIDLPIGSTFTCTTVAGVTTNRGIMVAAFSGVASQDVSGTSTSTSGTGTVQSITGNTLACPGGGANCEVVVNVWSNRTLGAQSSQTAGFTQFGCLTLNNANVCMAYEIVSAVTAQNYTSTNANSDSWAMLQFAFQATSSSTAKTCGVIGGGVWC